MYKKDQGFVEKLLPVLLSTGMVFGLVLFAGQLMEVLRTRELINQTARGYLLQMETTGYLTGEAMAGLMEELEENTGLTDISLSGSTMVPEDYGAKIQLVIEGNIEREISARFPMFFEENRTWKIPVHIRMLSTAKH